MSSSVLVSSPVRPGTPGVDLRSKSVGRSVLSDMLSSSRQSGDTTACEDRQLERVSNDVSSSRSLSPCDQLLVQVLVDGGANSMQVPLSGTDTIRELKMMLSNKSWFTSKHCIFFGNRELLDHQQVNEIMAKVQSSGSNSYLHVFVRTQDVRFGKLSAGASSVSFGNLQDLEGPVSPTQRSASGLMERHLSDAALTDASTARDIVQAPKQSLSTVLHVIIRKSAHVSWQASKGGEFELIVRASDTAAQVKQQLLPPGQESCASIVEDLDFFHNGVRLQADKPLLEYGLAQGDVLELVPWEPLLPFKPDMPRFSDMQVPELSSPAHELYLNWQKAALGLKAGIAPDLAPSGSGGSYFLRDTNYRVVAVFKPVDEEPNMRNNPRGFAPSTSPDDDLPCSSLRRGIKPGEGAHREIAAYLLDHGHRAGVPATAPVYVTYPDGSSKYGSLQQFVKSDCDCEEMGYSAFSVKEVHKIAVLDLRLANADRNGSNILARRDSDGQWILTPIDHGYCLPDTWEDMSFEWSSWRQARVPFDAETTDYIMALDPDHDLSLLQQRGVFLRPECVRIFKAANMVLRKVASLGLPPKCAAEILERNTLRKSTMEKMHRLACDRAIHEEGQDISDRLALVLHSSPTPTPRSSASGAVPISDSIYLKHLKNLLELYLDDLQPQEPF